MSDLPVPAVNCPVCNLADGYHRSWCVRGRSMRPDAAIVADLVQVAVKEGVVVRPGDTLVVRLDPDTSSGGMSPPAYDEMEMIREHLSRSLPLGARVIVMSAPGELGVVRRDEEAQDAEVQVDGRDRPAAGDGVGVDPGVDGDGERRDDRPGPSCTSGH